MKYDSILVNIMVHKIKLSSYYINITVECRYKRIQNILYMFTLRTYTDVSH